MNASDHEQMHLCSFGMFETWPSSMYSSSEKRSGTNIGISSRSGSRSENLAGSVISSMCGGGGEETTEMMWNGCLSVGGFAGSGG